MWIGFGDVFCVGIFVDPLCTAVRVRVEDPLLIASDYFVEPMVVALEGEQRKCDLAPLIHVPLRQSMGYSSTEFQHLVD